MRIAARFFSRRTLLADPFLYATPEGLGLAARDVEFESVGVLLRGWFLRGEKRGTVIFCAGNSGNVSGHLEYVRMVRETGHSVLCFDYRGFGRSEGDVDLRRVVDDVCAACRHARAIAGEDEPLGLFGISLGANAAIAATARGADTSPLRAVIVEGLSDVRDMLAGLFARNAFGPLRIREIVEPGGAALPRGRIEFGSRHVPPALATGLSWCAAKTYPFPGRQPRTLVSKLRDVPLLVVHGVDDALLPMEASLDVYSRLEGPRRLWLIPGAGHAQEPVMSHREEYVAQLGAFLGPAFTGTGRFDADARVHLREAPPGGFDVTVEPRPGLDGRGFLLTVVGRSTLSQRVVAAGRPVRVEVDEPPSVVTALPAVTLGPDGWPRSDLDPLSRSYREDGYRGVFRRLVRAVNGRDLEALDAGLSDYLQLERRYPFDFFAAAYCLRAALLARGGLPGWPAASRAAGRRSLKRFLALWGAHEVLPDENVPQSPAAWARRALDEG